MPRILAKFAVSSHGPCREKALSILKSLAMFCDPRDMFAAYMEVCKPSVKVSSQLICLLVLSWDAFITVISCYSQRFFYIKLFNLYVSLSFRQLFPI